MIFKRFHHMGASEYSLGTRAPKYKGYGTGVWNRGMEQGVWNRVWNRARVEGMEPGARRGYGTGLGRGPPLWSPHCGFPLVGKTGLMNICCPPHASLTQLRTLLRCCQSCSTRCPIGAHGMEHLWNTYGTNNNLRLVSDRRRQAEDLGDGGHDRPRPQLNPAKVE